MAHLYLSTTAGPWSPGDRVSLVGDEAHHAARVGRVAVSEQTAISDGMGHRALATIVSVGPGEVVCEVMSASFEARAVPEVWLAQALAKGDRDEAAIQAATELGIDGVIPYQAGRSVSQWRGDKVDKGVARWEKIVTEASKQAMRSWIPVVGPVVNTEGLCALAERYTLIVLDPLAPEALSDFRPLVAESSLPLLLIVGPEGGLSADEIQALVAAGATTRRLGTTILRTSSAGPAALALVNVALGRW